MISTLKSMFLLFIVLFFSSCVTQNIFSKSENTSTEFTQDEKLLRFDPAYQYTIRKDDKISISVWEQDELSVGSSYGIYNSNEVYGKWLMVDSDGKIEVPKYGSLFVNHMTIPELKQMLRDSLAQSLVNPIVDVKILNREISFLGEFRDPATITVDKERNYLLDLIAQVGGFEFYANLKQVKVLRQKGEHTFVIHVDLTEKGDYQYKNIALYPGDIVIAPSKKYKDFDKRISNIIPFTSAVTAAAILLK